MRKELVLLVMLGSVPANAIGLPALRIGKALSASAGAEAELVSRLQMLNVGPHELLHAVPRDDGKGYRTIIGRFQGLSKAIDLLSDDEIANEVHRIVNERRDVLGVSRDLELGTLRLKFVSPSDEFWTAEFDQVRGNLPIDDAGLTITFYPDGYIYSIAGQIEDFPAPAGPVPSLAEAVDRFATATGLPVSIGASRGLESPRGEWREAPPDAAVFDRGGNASGLAWPAIDRSTGEVVFRFYDATSAKNYAMDVRGFILDERSSSLYYTTTTCNILHFEFVRGSDGRANHIVAEDLSGNLLKTPITDAETCGANDWLGNCPWQLLRNEFRGGLERVQDQGGTEVQQLQACSSSTPVNFTGGVASGNFPEQSAFLFATRARSIMEQNLYARVTPNSTDRVEFYVRDTSHNISQYDPFFHDIFILSADRHRLTTIAHEYAHHSLWMYGLSTSSCTNNVNESSRIHETFAEVLQQLYVADDEKLLNMAYNGDPSDSSAGSHVASGNGTQDNSNDCDASDVHNEGLGLSEALWELMYNRNCTSGCTTARTAGTAIWASGTSHETSITNVGDAVASAFKNTPDDTTFEDIIAQMSARWVFRFGSTVASRAMAVIGHHGR